jgi:hypothetical protein
MGIVLLVPKPTRSENSVPREALRWNPHGKRKAGCLRNIWRTILNEGKKKGWSWDDLRRMANNRVR